MIKTRLNLNLLWVPFLPREYKAANISINLYIVNEPWLFSLVWCHSIHSVTTDNIEVLNEMNQPYYFMVSWLFRLFFLD